MKVFFSLHLACFYICCAITAVVFAILIYSLIKNRQSKGAASDHFHKHLGIEIMWTIIPFVILVALAVPALIVSQHNPSSHESTLTDDKISKK